MSRTARARAAVRLARPGNVIGAAILALVGAYVAAALTEPVPTAAAVIATALGTASGNAINDYFDREVDAINRPDRPIPAGDIAPRTALVLSMLGFAIAVVLTLAVLPVIAIGIAILNLVLLVTYTEIFKDTPGAGNLVVAFLVGSAIWFGGAAGGDVQATLVIGALAALATLAREILKDIEDMPGDRAAGLRTMPIVIGERPAWGIALGAVLLGAILSPLPYLRETFGTLYFVGLVPALLIMGYAGLIGPDAPARGQRLLKVGMYVALAGFVLGRLSA